MIVSRLYFPEILISSFFSRKSNNVFRLSKKRPPLIRYLSKTRLEKYLKLYDLIIVFSYLFLMNAELVYDNLMGFTLLV